MKIVGIFSPSAIHDSSIVGSLDVIDEDELADCVTQAMLERLGDDLPSELEALSSHAIVRAVDDVELRAPLVTRSGLHVRGSASVSVELERGGGSGRDGLGTTSSFPLRFDVQLDRSWETILDVHHLELDTSSWSE